MKDWLKILAIILPNALEVLSASQNPVADFRDALESVDVELGQEHVQLLADLAQDMKEGAK